MRADGRRTFSRRLVVPRYLAPDGTLKEAGSIIWRDGGAENFGRGDPDPGRARYLTRREVDYGSGACLLVRMEALRAAGGLDEAFSPAYFEDVDLCFAVRRAGYRVVYEPRAQVVHVEGATAGTDEHDPSATKHYQVVNRATFARKWSRTLREQPERGGDPRFAARRGAERHVWSRPRRAGPGARRRLAPMAAIVDELCALSAATVLPVVGGRAEDVARLRDRGVEVLRPEDVEPELAALGPRLDLAILSRPTWRPRFAYTIRRVAPGARLPTTRVACIHPREALQAAVEGAETGAAVDALRELELAMARTSDVTMVVTEEERALLAEHVPDAAIQVLGTIEDRAERVAPLAGRAGIVFVGSYLHPPNADAARFFARDVMPLVWAEHPGVVLRGPGLGAEPGADVHALAGPCVEVDGLRRRPRGRARRRPRGRGAGAPRGGAEDQERRGDGAGTPGRDDAARRGGSRRRRAGRRGRGAPSPRTSPRCWATTSSGGSGQPPGWTRWRCASAAAGRPACWSGCSSRVSRRGRRRRRASASRRPPSARARPPGRPERAGRRGANTSRVSRSAASDGRS